MGARRELRGQGPRLRMLVLWSGVGGAVGAALLLAGSSATFEHVVPWLVALGAVLLLARDWIRARLSRRQSVADVADLADPGGLVSPGGAAYTPPSWEGRLLIAVVAIYGGYFGAGVGIIMLAVLSLQTAEPLPVTNAVKNIGTMAANAVAAVVFAVVSPVNWPAAAALAIGSLIGGWCGPAVVRVLPENRSGSPSRSRASASPSASS
jgi:uncharacterized membrane protein YfcA